MHATDIVKQWIERLCTQRGEDLQMITLFIDELKSVPSAIYLSKKLEGYEPEGSKFTYLSEAIHGMASARLLGSVRYEERQKLEALLTEIRDASAGEFSTTHEVFAVLVRSAFSKSMSPAVRMIERTLGRPAVRRIVKDFSGRINIDEPQSGDRRIDK